MPTMKKSATAKKLNGARYRELPDSLKTLVKARLPKDEVLGAAASDLTRANQFGEAWLVCTDTSLVVIPDSATAKDDLECHALEMIETAHLVNRVGGSSVEITTKTDRMRIISYTNARAAIFGDLVGEIKNRLDGKDVKKRDAKDGKYCEHCNLPIPEDLGTCPRCSEKGKVLKRLLTFLRPYRFRVVTVFVLLITSTCFGLAPPYISKLFIDQILKPDPQTGTFTHGSWLFIAVGALAFSYLMQQVISGVQGWVACAIGHRTVHDVRSQVYTRLQELSLSYFDKHQIGSIMARVNQDTRELQRFLVDFVPMTLESLFSLIGVGCVLLLLSWKLTLFVMIPIVGTIVFVKRVFPRMRPYFKRYYHRRSRLSALVNDSLSGIRVVKSFGQETEELDKFHASSTAYRDAGVAMEQQWAIYHPLMHFFIMLGTVIVWAIGGLYVLRDQMTLGSVLAFAGYLAMFYRPVFTLTRMLEMILNSLIAAERVFDIIDTEPQIQNCDNPVIIPKIEGSLEFRNVSFGYNPFDEVIKDMNFKIKPNEVIGLVGHSGAGKSTLINLLCRLYDTSKGEVLVDGIDVRDIDYACLRQQIAVVLQETFLFNGTIHENIAYAKPDATRRQVVEAAWAANAHEFILQKPDGYDTEVGERGGRLSGGEKQRIAIARAILRNPRILILDEATSSVDTQTEKRIQEALETLTKGRTTIAIAHRLSTLRRCDRLFVIDDGILKEVGTHEELMKKDGIFANLVGIQSEMSQIMAIKG